MFPLQTLQTLFAIISAKSHLSKPCLQSYLQIPSLQTLLANAVCKPIILMQTCSGDRGVNTGNGRLHMDSIECTPSAIVAQARGHALLMLLHMIRMLGDGPAIALAHWSYRSRVQILSWPSHPLHATSLEVVAAPSSDTWHLTDHHSLHMEYLVLHTCEVIAFADWAWRTRLNTLLVRAISLVVEARARIVHVPTLLSAWRKG